MQHVDHSLEDLVLDVMIVFLDMLHFLMKCRVSHYKNGNIFVIIHWPRCLRDET